MICAALLGRAHLSHREDPAVHGGCGSCLVSLRSSRGYAGGGRLFGTSSAEISPGSSWGPPRRHAPCGASSICPPAPRDGMMARPNLTPAVVEPVHCGRKDRQASGTARGSPTANGGDESDTVSSAVQGDTTSPSGRRTRHTPRGAYVPSADRSTAVRRDLAPVGVRAPNPERAVEGPPAFTPGRMSDVTTTTPRTRPTDPFAVL